MLEEMYEEKKIPPQRKTEVRQEAALTVRKKVILVIDDNVDLRLTLAEVLTNDGFRVATAKNGVEALRYLNSKTHPDLILLDLAMPEMDGYDLMEKIREQTSLRKIPVIIISGEVDEVRIKKLAMDQLALMEKPIDFGKFMDVVEKATF